MSCGLHSPGHRALAPTPRPTLVPRCSSGMSVHKQCNVQASAAHARRACVRARRLFMV